MDNLPAAVQAQVDEADRISQMLTEGQDQPQQDAEQEPPAEQEHQELSELEPEQQVHNEEPAQETETPQPPTRSKGKKFKKLEVESDSEETFEQRYRSLMGMYNAEVPRLHAQLKEMREQTEMLHKELEDTRAQQQEQAAPAYTVTDEDREAFGPDLVNLIEKAAESKVSTVLQSKKQLEAEVESLKRRLGDVSEKQVSSERERYLSTLAQSCPNWEQLNTDPGFLQWLQQVDPVYGLPRQAALNSAHEAMDANRVAAIFNAYQGGQEPAQSKPTPKQELQRHVAPSTSRASAAPQGTQNSRIFTSQQVQEFYEDWRRGNISDEQAQRIESDIHAAAAEGRIR